MPLVLCAHLPLIDSLDSMNFLYLTDSLQEDVSTCLHNMPPHIDVLAEYNQSTSESANERHNRLQRKWRAKQCEQPSFHNDALQLFRDEDASASGRWDCGEMDTICGVCSVKMWIKEQLAKSTNNNPQFSLCCENGKVLLPNLPTTPQELEVLLTNKESSAVKFQDQICMYNSVLAFTSLGTKVDESVIRSPGPYSFRIQGELY